MLLKPFAGALAHRHEISVRQKRHAIMRGCLLVRQPRRPLVMSHACVSLFQSEGNASRFIILFQFHGGMSFTNCEIATQSHAKYDVKVKVFVLHVCCVNISNVCVNLLMECPLKDGNDEKYDLFIQKGFLWL